VRSQLSAVDYMVQRKQIGCLKFSYLNIYIYFFLHHNNTGSALTIVSGRLPGTGKTLRMSFTHFLISYLYPKRCVCGTYVYVSVYLCVCISLHASIYVCEFVRLCVRQIFNVCFLTPKRRLTDICCLLPPNSGGVSVQHLYICLYMAVCHVHVAVCLCDICIFVCIWLCVMSVWRCVCVTFGYACGRVSVCLSGGVCGDVSILKSAKCMCLFYIWIYVCVAVCL